MKSLEIVNSYRSSLAKVCLCLAALCSSASAFAKSGDPLAIRLWPDDVVSVESFWGLEVYIDLGRASVSDGARANDLDATSGRVTVGTDQAINHVLDRLPNQTLATWTPAEQTRVASPHAIRVRCPGGRSEDQAASSVFLIDADGVTIVVVAGDQLRSVQGQFVGDVRPDVMVIATDDAAKVQAWARKESNAAILPRRIVLSSASGSSDVDGSNAHRIDHNTMAVSASGLKVQPMQWFWMTDQPWQMKASLVKPFDAMEAACQKSQQVFAKLSAKQLNFRPSNGTHTPRWNAEHMMGRQLLFFSQIYHAIDDQIPVMDQNPKQMPPDYTPAHPEWDGVEEARQMQRVSDFCRRFAYLLQGIEPEDKAPGSRWPTLRALMKQMQRHYGEHTTNTIAKFELVDFPDE
ncbi:DinB family protein [Crateriforma conspicua]|uniref:DinB superfamily protein n=1 Tax=Crateriforma conspicua TaxID=2527996 RepID=A0A5C5Y0Y2_9PLAN|nr:DinB family protein [Crateriforma conspicua]TWT68469.1 DinB superfamily protein [Crateriforma conspicua]